MKKNKTVKIKNDANVSSLLFDQNKLKFNEIVKTIDGIIEQNIDNLNYILQNFHDDDNYYEQECEYKHFEGRLSLFSDLHQIFPENIKNSSSFKDIDYKKLVKDIETNLSKKIDFVSNNTEFGDFSCFEPVFNEFMLLIKKHTKVKKSA